ncbi:M20 family metallo-hydrolase [Luteolibacter luteus]|uniref:M20 family metallo-hydrolase n=1 Tax=Luteolibacter luteus TaxID=2728835 RepID=A0A858RG19_9BACT|nr:M20 family metallo-hydrolase [Luteolibacter luteus]QJE96066.1 M20 family metallo-hydrolase [Luteolibacter luteus]
MSTVSLSRLDREIEELAAISAHPAPAVTRVLFSAEDLRAREWLTARAKDAGFRVRKDPVGNLFVCWEGSEPCLPAVATGSHTDAIPNAGKYDGVVGVLGGLEAMRQLKEAGHVPKRGIELIMFTSEEPTRFGIGCLGSRLMAGTTSPEEAGALRDAEGRSLDELREAAGCRGNLGAVKLSTGAYRAFVELHIEQGPMLEEKQIDIGIVEKIAAPSAFRLLLKGAGGHAGAVLMRERQDAFMAAAEIALLVEKAALESGSSDTVGTVGVVEVRPGAINSIPCDVKLEVDFRDTDREARDRALARIGDGTHALCRRRGVKIEWQVLNQDPPALCDPGLVKMVEAKAVAAGFSTSRMVSRAYHDSLFMARVCPTAMIFIPCFKGYSHRPDEYSSPEAIAKGVEVLKECLKELSLQ